MSARFLLVRLILPLTALLLVSVLAFSQKSSPPPRTTTSAGAEQWDCVQHSNEFDQTLRSTLAADEGTVEFRAETTLIQVPVVVTDKNGNHIRGLTKDDFHITENGKEQKISTFEELVASTNRIATAPTQPDEYSNLAVSLSAQQPHAVSVIVIDTINTPFLDQVRGRHALIKYLADNIDTRQILALMVITSRGVYVVQGLTGDPQLLLQVLRKVSGEIPQSVDTPVDIQANAAFGEIPHQIDSSNSTNLSDMRAAVQALQDYTDTVAAQFQQARAIEMTMHGFLGIAWALSGVPGRKSIIWCTSGFPFVLSAPDVVPGIFGPLYERTINALIDNQISVYPVDVRGIMTTGEGEARQAGSISAQQMNNRTWLLWDTYHSLDEFADMTGGTAFYNTNDLSGSFKSAADDSSSYYLVGYYLDTKDNHAGWRQQKVKVNKKGVEIHARKGFFITKATVQPDFMRDYELQTALTNPVDATGVPVSLKWTDISGEGAKKKAGFVVEIPPNGVSIEGGQGSRLKLDLAVSAYRTNSKDDKPVVTIGQNVNTPVTPEQLATVRSKGIAINQNLEIAPGQYIVRLVVRDSATGKIGSVTAPLTVN